MASILNDVSLPLAFSAPEAALTDDEIAVHAEALDDGRDAALTRASGPSDFQDDEIDSHLEEAAMVFSMPARVARRRRPTRH